MSSKPSDQNTEGGASGGGTDGSLGEQLRRARLARSISLREISDQTRITMRHLEAIESDDYKHLPGGIFNRSFIKAFARAVGFDEKRALDLYARQLRERGENPDDPATTQPRSRIYTDGDAGRSPLLTFALSALLVGILCLGIYALWKAYEKRYGTPGAQDAKSAAAQGNAAQATPRPTPAAAGELQVQLKPTRSFYLTVELDGKRVLSSVVKPDTALGPYKPESGLTVIFDNNAQSLEVTINGQPARIPADAPGKITVTRQNYQEFLR